MFHKHFVYPSSAEFRLLRNSLNAMPPPESTPKQPSSVPEITLDPAAIQRIAEQRQEQHQALKASESQNKQTEEPYLVSLMDEIENTDQKVLPEDLRLMGYELLKDFAKTHVPGLKSLGIDFQTSNGVDLKSGVASYSIYESSGAVRLDAKTLLATITVDKEGKVSVKYDQKERLADKLFEKTAKDWKPGMDADLLRATKEAVTRIGELPAQLDAATMLRIRKIDNPAKPQQLFEFLVKVTMEGSPSGDDDIVLGTIRRDEKGEHFVNVTESRVKMLQKILTEAPKTIIPLKK